MYNCANYKTNQEFRHMTRSKKNVKIGLDVKYLLIMNTIRARASYSTPRINFCLALLAIPPRVKCSPPHVKVICCCPVPISSKFCPHMQWCRTAICVFVVPAHLASFIFSILSLTLVLFLITEFLTLSPIVIFNIFLSIACCAEGEFSTNVF